MSLTTLYTLNQRNYSDGYIGLVEDQTQYSPTFYSIPAVAYAGTYFETTTRTALPSAGFRQANTGVTGSASTYKQSLHQLYYLYVPIFVDKMIYQGDQGQIGDLLMQEAQGALQSSLNLIEYQTWYGNPPTDNSYGFVGLRQQLLSSQATNPTATPVTASNGTNTSTCYGLWLNPQGVSYAVGKYGEIAFPSFKETVVTTATGATGTSPSLLEGYFTAIQAWIGLPVISNNAVFGITGVTGIGGSAPLTDPLGAQLLANVPLTRRQGFTWFMNRQVHAGLQKSRSAINYQPASPKSATPAWSGPPLEMEGLPIILTDGILNNENNS